MALPIPLQAAANLPGGRKRPPYNIMANGRQARQVDDSRGVSPLCVGADACIGPSAGLANNCRFRITARLRVPCKAGDFARRGALRHRWVSGTMEASSPTDAGQGPAGV